MSHAAEMAPVLNDVRLHYFIGGRPLSEQELRARYARQVHGHSPDGREHWLNWIVRRRNDGAGVGVVQATVTDAGAQLAWTIAVAEQGRGYAREAATAVLQHLRDGGVQRFVAHIHPDHAASAAVAGGLGLIPTDVVVDGETRWALIVPRGAHAAEIAARPDTAEPRSARTTIPG